MRMTRLLEICIDSIESAKAAIDGGANRLEVCSALAVGGLTPTLGFIKTIKRMAEKSNRKIQVFAMIRPRDGDFCYSESDVAIMTEDINAMRMANVVDGFVFGLLKCDGSIDCENCISLMHAANGLPVTFHRAFDACKDVFHSLETVIELGFKRVLTSGQKNVAASATSLIAELVRRANGRIIIMPGSGINLNNLHSIVEATKAEEFHSSASVERHSSMQFVNEVMRTHFLKSRVTETNIVHDLVNALNNV